MERASTWLPRAIAAGALCLYAATAPAGPYWLGAADAAAGAASMGATGPAHPAALPLGALASLLPIGELAYRVHLMSALCAAIAVWLVARLVLEAGQDDRASQVGAACAAIGLAVALPFSRDATVAGPGALGAALAALALVLLVRVARGDGARAGLGLALVAGVGLAAHPAHWALAAVLFALCSLRLRRGARWPLAAPLVAAAGAGALFAYLPVRAIRSSAGGPSTLGDVVAHLAPPGAADGLSADLLWMTVEPLGPGMLVACAGGAIRLAMSRRERWLLAALCALLVGDLIGAGGERAGGAVFAVGAATLAGVGVAWLAQSLGRAGAYAGAAATTLVALPAALASAGVLSASAPGDGPRRFADAALTEAPSGARVVTRSAAADAALRYHQLAERARPDLEVRSRRDEDRVIARGAGELIVWEIGPPEPPPGFDVFVRAAPFARLVPAADGGGDLEQAARKLAVSARAAMGDPQAAAVYADALAQLGELARARGDDDLARTLDTATLALEPARAAAASSER